MKEMVKKKWFWNHMDRTVDSVGSVYRLCLLGDINGWIGQELA